MKTILLFLAICGLILAAPTTPGDGAPKAGAPMTSTETVPGKPEGVLPDPVTKLNRELADAHAQVQAQQAQLQQQGITAEYYKAVAEKNEAYLRLIALSNENEELKKQLADAKAQSAARGDDLDMEKAKVESLLKTVAQHANGPVTVTATKPIEPAKK